MSIDVPTVECTSGRRLSVNKRDSDDMASLMDEFDNCQVLSLALITKYRAGDSIASGDDDRESQRLILKLLTSPALHSRMFGLRLLTLVSEVVKLARNTVSDAVCTVMYDEMHDTSSSLISLLTKAIGMTLSSSSVVFNYENAHGYMLFLDMIHRHHVSSSSRTTGSISPTNKILDSAFYIRELGTLEHRTLTDIDLYLRSISSNLSIHTPHAYHLTYGPQCDTVDHSCSRWKGTITTQTVPFLFCEYPWCMDAAAKTILLRYSSLRKMCVPFKSSFIEVLAEQEIMRICGSGSSSPDVQRRRANTSTTTTPMSDDQSPTMNVPPSPPVQTENNLDLSSRGPQSDGASASRQWLTESVVQPPVRHRRPDETVARVTVPHPPVLSMPPRSRDIPYFMIAVRRSRALQDALYVLTTRLCNPRHGGINDILKPMRVVFAGEEGLDAGGVAKEFFAVMIDELFNAKYGLFLSDDFLRADDSNASRFFWINPWKFENVDCECDGHDQDLCLYLLAGILMALGPYNGIHTNLRVPRVFFKKLVNYARDSSVELNIDDLYDIDSPLAVSLTSLLTIADPTDLGLTFSIDEQMYGERVKICLVPGGDDVIVTKSNVVEFVEKYVHYKLVDSIADRFDSFAKGFFSILDKHLIGLFSAEELESSFCGSQNFDVAELRANTTYRDGYTAQSSVINMFWEWLMHESPSNRLRLLEFVTASARVPVQGVGAIKFVIQRNGSSDDRLPSASTCFNILMLPEYSSLAVLTIKMRLALENTKGFGLR